MRDCPDHGVDGRFAIAENLLSRGTLTGTHSHKGWPDFDGWPRHDSLTHEGTYWKAVERAWRGGLRILVADLVENRALCEIYWLKKNPCGDMDSIRLQAMDLYDIDAQFKGPGRGFFRIVKSPRMIDKGMIIETDHFSVRARAQALAILESRGYSGAITSHSWGDETSRRRIQALGGFVAPYANTTKEFIAEWQEARATRSGSFVWGIGFGTDTNGLGKQAAPRPDAVSNNPVTYPILSFIGSRRAHVVPATREA